jgi:hypothetical protein
MFFVTKFVIQRRPLRDITLVFIIKSFEKSHIRFKKRFPGTQGSLIFGYGCALQDRPFKAAKEARDGNTALCMGEQNIRPLSL